MEETTSSLWPTNYGRLGSVLRLSGGHVLTEDNPTHRASRNKLVSIENQLVGRNQSGLVTQEMAKSLVTLPSKESNQEAKTTKELFALVVNFDDELGELLSKNTH